MCFARLGSGSAPCALFFLGGRGVGTGPRPRPRGRAAGTGTGRDSAQCAVQLLPGADSHCFALLGYAPQELSTTRPEAKLLCKKLYARNPNIFFIALLLSQRAKNGVGCPLRIPELARAPPPLPSLRRPSSTPGVWRGFGVLLYIGFLFFGAEEMDFGPQRSPTSKYDFELEKRVLYAL
jgi:hypothetical protein